jgi:hypothetical protein
MAAADNARATMSRGSEEHQIGWGVVMNVPALLQSRKTSSNTPMASTVARTTQSTVSPPIRVLITARPALLDSYQSDTNCADTELIHTFLKQ